MRALVIFGGTDPDAEFQVKASMFDTEFSVAYCKIALEVVGACPLTMPFLSDVNAFVKSFEMLTKRRTS